MLLGLCEVQRMNALGRKTSGSLLSFRKVMSSEDLKLKTCIVETGPTQRGTRSQYNMAPTGLGNHVILRTLCCSGSTRLAYKLNNLESIYIYHNHLFWRNHTIQLLFENSYQMVEYERVVIVDLSNSLNSANLIKRFFFAYMTDYILVIKVIYTCLEYHWGI